MTYYRPHFTVEGSLGVGLITPGGSVQSSYECLKFKVARQRDFVTVPVFPQELYGLCGVPSPELLDVRVHTNYDSKIQGNLKC